MALAFLLLGGFLLYQATRLSMRSLDGSPGPGLLPAALGLLMMVLAARLLFRAWREPVHFGKVRRILLMIGSVAVYTLVLEMVGFVMATGALMSFLMLLFNERLRLPLATLGVVGAFLSYALFHIGLKVQLPADPWGLWR